MKKILLYAVMLFTAIGCQISPFDEEVTAPSDELISATVKAEMPSSNSDTRVGVTPDGDGWKTEWEDGDKLVLVSTADNNTIYELATMNKLDDGKATFSGEVAEGEYEVYCVKDYTQDEAFAVDYSKQIVGTTQAYSNVPMGAEGRISVVADANNSFTSPLLHFMYVAQVVDITLDFPNVDNSYTLSSIKLSGFTSADGTENISLSVAEGVEVSSSASSQVLSCYLPAFVVASGESLKVVATFTTDYASSAVIENSGDDDVVFEAGKHNSIYAAFDEIAEKNWINFAADTFAGGVAYDDATLSYSISTAEEFALLAKLVNDGTPMEGKTFTLANDIDLSGMEWTAIGNGNDFYKFQGTFDGAGHAVMGLYINKPEVSFQGLFSFTKGATIKNLSVSGSVTGNQYTGGVVGEANSSTIIINCYNSCSVTGSLNIGGVVGHAFFDTTISNCYNSGSLDGSSGNTIGGIVGYANENSTISNCYNSGSVKGVSRVGGVVGSIYSSTITNCYWDKEKWANGIGDSYNITTNGDFKGMTAAEMQSEAFKVTLSKNAYAYNNTNPKPTEAACAWVAVDGGYPTFDYDAEPTYTVMPFEGEGTESNPYKIATAEDMRKLSLNVNIGKETYYGKYFEMTNDIDLGGIDSNGNGIAENEFTAIGWYNSYYSNALFQGTFDGADFTIKGLYINQPEVNYQALFGYISTATIKNLSVAGSVVGKGSTAGVVGYSTSSKVTNCYNTASVEGKENCVGGIAGSSYSSSVTNCYNTESVKSSDRFVGGIIGDSSSSTITNCYNTASVKGDSNVGGIVAQLCNFSTITNCYNTGSIEGKYNSIGGVVGCSSDSTVTNCYNTASVDGNEAIGGVVGDSFSSTVTNCYWDNSFADAPTKGIGDDDGASSNIVGRSTAEMQSSAFVILLNNGAYTYNQTSPNIEAYAWKAVLNGFPTFDRDAEPTFTQMGDVEPGVGM